MREALRHLLRPALAAALAALIASQPATALAETAPAPAAPAPAGPAGAGVVVDRGHVDLGPRFVDGAWRMQVRDGTVEPAVWREPDDVVLHVRDAARLTMPEDPAYAFVGEQAGDTVHVIPQTEMPGVVWAGWNSQDPEVVARVKRQVAFTLVDVQGPGSLLLYLLSGNLTAPQVLWDSRRIELQDVFMDSNVHTHGNWIFTEPGIYLVTAEFSAELKDGSTVTDRRTLRFAVGDDADPQAALAAVPDPADGGGGDGARAGALSDGAPAKAALWGLPQEAVTALLVALGSLTAAAVVTVVAVGAVRSRRAKAQAAAERA